MKNTALITGASSGIGLALARQFAYEGWDLVLVARRQANLEKLSKELMDDFGCRSHSIAFDLSKENAARALYDEIRFRNIQIDCLVNNAGRGHYDAFAGLDWQLEEETIYLNVTVLTSLCKLFGKDMLDRGEGRILNIASIAGFVPGPRLAVYHASKAYVVSLSRALHAEFADHGVTVTVSCPGPTESEFFAKAGTDNLAVKQYIKLMSADEVALQAYSATMKGQDVVVHGWLNRLIVETPRIVPKSWVAPFVKKFMK